MGYSIDPAEMLDILVTQYGSDADAASVLTEVMVWHTHPSGHEGPSQADLDAKLPDFRYLVVSMPSGVAVEF